MSARSATEPSNPGDGATGGAYERLAYPGYAYPATHPARLEVVGRLFGLKPAPAAQARVLELGCGDGGNLLSLAQVLPDAIFVGIDASEQAIARGEELARTAGLSNIELCCSTFEALEPDALRLGGEIGAARPQTLGEEGQTAGFDYILSHGVYSWIPPRARVALLAAVHRHLAPEGIAYVSYNAYPGSHMRDMARDILAFHVRDIGDPQRKLDAAHELMRAIVEIEEPTPYARMLREHMERMLRYSDALLFHDDLAEIATPFYLHQIVEHANHHGLAFLAEADLSESQMRGVPESAASLMDSLPDDVVVREQYLDFFKNRMFRQTLLCHGNAPVNRELDDSVVESLWVSSSARPEPQQSVEGHTFATPEGFTVTTSEPLVQAALSRLAEEWPAAVSFSALLDVACDATGTAHPRDLVAARLRVVLLQACLGRIVQLQSCPAPISPRPDGRPSASGLARAQCAAGLPAVSSLLHANVRLEGELDTRLLMMLDGTRSVDELARELDALGAEVDAVLDRFASLGLLSRPIH